MEQVEYRDALVSQLESSIMFLEHMVRKIGRRTPESPSSWGCPSIATIALP